MKLLRAVSIIPWSFFSVAFIPDKYLLRVVDTRNNFHFEGNYVMTTIVPKTIG